MSLEKSDLLRFLSGSIRNGIRRILHPAHHGGSGTIPGGAHKIHSHLMTRTCVAQVQVWRAQRTLHIISCVIFVRSCCVFDSPRLSLPPLAVYLLSCRLVHLPNLQLLLPRCRGQIPCALPLMRTLAPLPSTTLSKGAQKMSQTWEQNHSAKQ